jgi:ribose transport system substrate-binding protein
LTGSGPALNGAKVAALKGKTVLYVPFTLAGAPFVDAQTSLKAALADVGINMSTCDPNGVPSSVSNCLNNAKTDGASAIVTGDIPYNIAPDAYKAVEAQHIPTLVSVAGPGNPADSKYLAFQIDDQQTQTIGQVIADTAIADSGGKGHILFVSNTDSTSLEAQAKTTVATVKHDCPDCQITDLPFSIANLTQLPTNVSSAMVDHPGVNVVLSQVDILLPDVDQGLASSGNAQSIEQVGATGSLSTLQAMAKSSKPVVGDVGLDYDYSGWVAADGILRMLLGEPVPANPLIPLRIFTPSNVQSLSLTSASDQNTWYGVSNISKTFNQLWGVK